MPVPEPSGILWHITVALAPFNPFPPDNEDDATRLAEAWLRAADQLSNTLDQAQRDADAGYAAWPDHLGYAWYTMVSEYLRTRRQLAENMRTLAGNAADYAQQLYEAKVQVWVELGFAAGEVLATFLTLVTGGASIPVKIALGLARKLVARRLAGRLTRMIVGKAAEVASKVASSRFAPVAKVAGESAQEAMQEVFTSTASQLESMRAGYRDTFDPSALKTAAYAGAAGGFMGKLISPATKRLPVLGDGLNNAATSPMASHFANSVTGSDEEAGFWDRLTDWDSLKESYANQAGSAFTMGLAHGAAPVIGSRAGHIALHGQPPPARTTMIEELRNLAGTGSGGQATDPAGGGGPPPGHPATPGGQTAPGSGPQQGGQSQTAGQAQATGQTSSAAQTSAAGQSQATGQTQAPGQGQPGGQSPGSAQAQPGTTQPPASSGPAQQAAGQATGQNAPTGQATGPGQPAGSLDGTTAPRPADPGTTHGQPDSATPTEAESNQPDDQAPSQPTGADTSPGTDPAQQTGDPQETGGDGRGADTGTAGNDNDTANTGSSDTATGTTTDTATSNATGASTVPPLAAGTGGAASTATAGSTSVTGQPAATHTSGQGPATTNPPAAGQQTATTSKQRQEDETEPEDPDSSDGTPREVHNGPDEAATRPPTSEQSADPAPEPSPDDAVTPEEHAGSNRSDPTEQDATGRDGTGQDGQTGAAAALRAKNLHGAGRRRPAFSAVRGTVRDLLSKADSRDRLRRQAGVRTLEFDPAGDTAIVTTHGGRRFSVKVTADAIPPDASGRIDPARYTFSALGIPQVTVSDRATSEAIPSALVHEIAELGKIADLGKISRPGDITGIDRDLAHYHGRIAQVRELGDRSDETPALRILRRRRMAAAMGELVEELGVAPHQDGAGAKWAALPDDVRGLIPDGDTTADHLRKRVVDGLSYGAFSVVIGLGGVLGGAAGMTAAATLGYAQLGITAGITTALKAATISPFDRWVGKLDGTRAGWLPFAVRRGVPALLAGGVVGAMLPFGLPIGFAIALWSSEAFGAAAHTFVDFHLHNSAQQRSVNPVLDAQGQVSNAVASNVGSMAWHTGYRTNTFLAALLDTMADHRLGGVANTTSVVGHVIIAIVRAKLAANFEAPANYALEHRRHQSPDRLGTVADYARQGVGSAKVHIGSALLMLALMPSLWIFVVASSTSGLADIALAPAKRWAQRPFAQRAKRREEFQLALANRLWPGQPVITDAYPAPNPRRFPLGMRTWAKYWHRPEPLEPPAIEELEAPHPPPAIEHLAPPPPQAPECPSVPDEPEQRPCPEPDEPPDRPEPCPEPVETDPEPCDTAPPAEPPAICFVDPCGSPTICHPGKPFPREAPCEPPCPDDCATNPCHSYYFLWHCIDIDVLVCLLSELFPGIDWSFLLELEADSCLFVCQDRELVECLLRALHEHGYAPETWEITEQHLTCPVCEFGRDEEHDCEQECRALLHGLFELAAESPVEPDIIAVMPTHAAEAEPAQPEPAETGPAETEPAEPCATPVAGSSTPCDPPPIVIALRGEDPHSRCSPALE